MGVRPGLIYKNCLPIGYRRISREGLITEELYNMGKSYAPTLTVHQDKSGKWRWRMTAHNGDIMATGHQSYSSKSNAVRAARRFPVTAAEAKYEAA